MSALYLAAAMQLLTVVGDPSVRQYKATETVTIEPGSSYVVIRSNYQMGVRLLRKVDDADRAAWEAERQTAYDKARKSYDKKLRSYERDIDTWNNGSNFDRQMIRSKPQKPAEVKLESIPIAPVEMRNFAGANRKPAIAEETSGMRTYLLKVKPGTYYLYGVSGLGIGQGTCFCMGTVGFTVEPGRVVDAGAISATGPEFFASPTYTLPAANPQQWPTLSGRGVEPARMFAVGKLANIHATPITRLNAVPGVLAYDRDIPLDVANGNARLSAVR